MIRLRTILRVTPAVWLAFPLWVFAGWYVTLLAPSAGYGLDASAKASMTLAFVGSVAAACAAWEGSRLRRGQVWNLPSVRSRAVIAAWAVLPTVLIGLFAVLVAIAVQLLRSSAAVPDLRIVAVAALDLIAYATAGFAVGLLLPFAVAGPLALAGTFVWIGFVPAIYPVWLRHLTGMFRDCCGLEQDLAPRAVVASALVDLGIVAAAGILVRTQALLPRRAAGALAALAMTVVAGVLLVAGMTYAPAVPRDPALLACRTADSAAVCLWPEQQARAAQVASIIAKVRARWQVADIDPPRLVTEVDRSLAPIGALVVQIPGSWSSEDEVIASLARGMLPGFPDCSAGGTGFIAFVDLEAWYASAGGMSPTGLKDRYAFAMEPFAPALTVVSQLRKATSDVRRGWVQRARQVSQACNDWDPKLIAVR